MVEGFAERPMNSPLVNLRGVQALLSKTSLRGQPVMRWLFAAALLALSFAVRYLLDDRLPVGFPYLTFFPAVIITSFFAGVIPGVAVAFLAGLFAWYFFIPPFDSFALTGGSTLALSFYVFIVAVDILLIHWMQLALDRLEIEKESAARHAGERDLLFRELQHRVSNNLAVVSSLLNAQSRGTTSTEASAVLQQASARISLISKIQRQLHDPGRQSLDLGPYLTQLGPDLLEASGVANIRYEVDAEAVEVSAELAVPLGLIATELISNSIEHGCADGRSGRIVVELSRDAGDAESRETPIRLTVSDDGPGWPEGFSVSSSRNLGMRIVASLSEQIGGVFEISNAGGAVSTLRFSTRDELAD
ncbi:histidine kinase dimerization/phosphoacceptor domain -containing protein [Aurantimonas sp. E1-2-R+4]|uniref:sensor histidine kinase n=1 Tax=Aurantimonas sp. E1-2-R+4 TaxID=3113714 RepID=UPI002F9285DC